MKYNLKYGNMSKKFWKTKADENFITPKVYTKTLSRKGTIVFLKKKRTVKAMTKRGYVWTYFGFSWVVVGGGGYIFVGGDWWWLVVVGGIV